MKKLSYRLPFYLSILLYLCSLGLTFYASRDHEIPGVFYLLGGWLYFMNDIPSFIAWLANITYFLGLFSVGKKKDKKKPIRGLIYSSLTLLLGLVGFGVGKIESETSSKIMHQAELGSGYYVWIISFVLLVASMVLRLQHRKKEK